MAQAETRKLDAGDKFPELTFTLTDGSSIDLPSEWAGKWGVILFYRGHW